MTYTPRPGSIAERAIAALSESGRMTRRELADAVGCASGHLAPNIEAALKHGAIVKVTVADGGPVFFRLPMSDRDSDRDEAAPGPDAEPESEALVAGRFVALLDPAGEMELFGGRPVVTGTGVTGVRLSADDVLQLRRLLNGSLVVE
ncbi:MAG TPA: hypothetical protein PK177_09785 [Burkholderiaceae bacterium]|nr:hypothetical protein [Burkholderiaceae bacterium]